MKHNEAVSFIRKAITTQKPESWADLGCGAGTFTKALAELLPAGSHITAIDRENQYFDIKNVDFMQADFEKDELNLSGLDGILLANSIHYTADKVSLIRKLETAFTYKPKFLVIEYDTDKANPWVPYPVSFSKLQALFKGIGYSEIDKLNQRPSSYHSGNMYCALITR